MSVSGRKAFTFRRRLKFSNFLYEAHANDAVNLSLMVYDSFCITAVGFPESIQSFFNDQFTEPCASRVVMVQYSHTMVSAAMASTGNIPMDPAWLCPP